LQVGSVSAPVRSRELTGAFPEVVMESLTFPDGALSPVLPTTECAKNYSDEHLRFLQAIDRYKRCNRRPFPTWFEVFEVFRSLGYRLTEAATEFPRVGTAHLKKRARGRSCRN
jgi:hypothetical protein